MHLYKCFASMHRRSGRFSSAWWNVRNALRFALCDQWWRGYVYGALSQLPYLWDLNKQEQKGVGMLKSHQLVVAMQVTKGGALFIEKAGSYCVILLYCGILWQVLLSLYCKKFYWMLPFTIYYCCFTCLRLAKPKVQLKVS